MIRLLLVITSVLLVGCASTQTSKNNAATKHCLDAQTTVDMQACMGNKLTTADAQLAFYLAQANERYMDEAPIMNTLQQSQQAWLAYRQSYCEAIHTLWSDGSIKGVMVGQCMLKLTNQRTHQIWQDYLTFMDSTPPLLPEPQ